MTVKSKLNYTVRFNILKGISNPFNMPRRRISLIRKKTYDTLDINILNVLPHIKR